MEEAHKVPSPPAPPANTTTPSSLQLNMHMLSRTNQSFGISSSNHEQTASTGVVKQSRGQGAVEVRGGSPVVMALTLGRVEILGVLLSVPDINLSVPAGGQEKPNHRTIGQLAVESLASTAHQCVEVLAKHSKVDWNVRDQLGDTPIMHAFKQQKMEIVKVLLRTPGVDLSEIRRQDFTMFQSFLFDAIQVHSNKLSDLRRKVPECPVSLKRN